MWPPGQNLFHDLLIPKWLPPNTEDNYFYMRPLAHGVTLYLQYLFRQELGGGEAAAKAQPTHSAQPPPAMGIGLAGFRKRTPGLPPCLQTRLSSAQGPH